MFLFMKYTWVSFARLEKAFLLCPGSFLQSLYGSSPVPCPCVLDCMQYAESCCTAVRRQSISGDTLRL